MNSNPAIEAVAVFISLAAAASISVDVEEAKPATLSMKTKKVPPPVKLVVQPVLQTTETTASLLCQP